MQLHAWAPSSAPPPELYCRWTWVNNLGLSWSDLGGIDEDEISILTQLVNMKREADDIKTRVDRKGKRH